MNKFVVKSLDKKTCDDWVVKKHYSRRKSIFWAGFGLYEYDVLSGVVVYGQPSPPIQKYSFVDRDFKLYELSRLVIQTDSKNAASFLIGNSLKMLDKPNAVVSYADSEQSHCGIVYQATNWLFTGSTISHDHLYLINGIRTHPMTLRDKGITNPKQWAKDNHIQTVKPLAKHRYFYINGNKKEKKIMLSKLKYPIINEYPKCDQNRYDDGSLIGNKDDLKFLEVIK